MPLLLRFDESDRLEYRFSPPRPTGKYLQALKARESLDKVVQGCRDEEETARRLCVWASRRMGHDGIGQAKKQDPISILEEADEGKRLRCVEFAVLLVGCLRCFDIPARGLGIKAKNVETAKSGAGHVVVEAYLKQYDKWAMFDAQSGACPRLRGNPLNAVELQRALSKTTADLRIFERGGLGVRKSSYMRFVRRYLFFFDTLLDRTRHLMLVPLGYSEPRAFQRGPPLSGYVYTHSLATFYQRPTLAQNSVALRRITTT